MENATLCVKLDTLESVKSHSFVYRIKEIHCTLHCNNIDL